MGNVGGRGGEGETRRFSRTASELSKGAVPSHPLRKTNYFSPEGLTVFPMLQITSPDLFIFITGSLHRITVTCT